MFRVATAQSLENCGIPALQSSAWRVCKGLWASGKTEDGSSFRCVEIDSGTPETVCREPDKTQLRKPGEFCLFSGAIRTVQFSGCNLSHESMILQTKLID